MSSVCEPGAKNQYSKFVSSTLTGIAKKGKLWFSGNTQLVARASLIPISHSPQIDAPVPLIPKEYKIYRASLFSLPLPLLDVPGP